MLAYWTLWLPVSRVSLSLYCVQVLINSDSTSSGSGKSYIATALVKLLNSQKYMYNAVQVSLDAEESGKQRLWIPLFEKSLFHGDGDRLPRSQWPSVSGLLDILAFEG